MHMTTPNSGTGISLEKLQAEAPGLVSFAKAAAVSLDKHVLSGQRAAVYLVLDHSGSMQRYYTDGSVQHLAEQALGLSVNLDDDGTVPLIYFADAASAPIDIDLTAYTGIINRTHLKTPWGYTDYAAAIDTVCALHETTFVHSDRVPGFVIFQTDGQPFKRAGGARAARQAAERALKDASHAPLFFSFVGFGDPSDSEFDFLRKLDTLRVGFGGRKVDNAAFFAAGALPQFLPDATLYDNLIREFGDWLTAARNAKILRD
jgi:hypothetical protein